MFFLRVSKKSIPLWFRSFKGGHDSSEVFQESLFKEGIKYVSGLFEDKNYQLIFHADRWFTSPAVLEYIDSLGHIYVIRSKSTNYVYHYDKKEKHYIRTKASDLFHYIYKTTYYENVFYTKEKSKLTLYSLLKNLSLSLIKLKMAKWMKNGFYLLMVMLNVLLKIMLIVLVP